MLSLAPTIKQQSDNFRPRQQWTAFVHAESYLLEYCLVGIFQCSQMREGKAAGISDLRWHEIKLSHI